VAARLTLEERLVAFAADAAGLEPRATRVTALKQDASNRSYHRVAQGDRSYVVMVMPVDGAARSEEATKGGPPAELPFVNVHRYLHAAGVPVPRIHRYDAPAGLMLLEDLGDTTFEKALQAGDREALYGGAVELLAALRASAERRTDAGCLAFTRAFDRELYRWALDHF
jgi:hypothetical protein